MTELELVPLDLKTAKRYVNEHHRHNEAPRGWKFGVGLARDGQLLGVVIVGRPTGRGLDPHRSVEITRLCIAPEGAEKNACSRLYGAACRAATALGYLVAYTYTLVEEDAASVKAAGFLLDAELGPRASWSTLSRPRQDENLLGERKRPAGAKRRWRRDLA